MGVGIDLPTLAKAVKVPYGTLRYWASEHQIKPIRRVAGRGIYRVADFKPMLLAWNDRREAA